MSERAWFTLFGLVVVLGYAVAVVCFIAAGFKLARRGLRMIPPRVWRRVAARVERAEVFQPQFHVYRVWVYYSFVLHRTGAEPRLCRARTVLPQPSRTYADAENLAMGASALRTIDIWYAESDPSLQYTARPNAAWQAVKGIILVALGLVFAGLPFLFFVGR